MSDLTFDIGYEASKYASTLYQGAFANYADLRLVQHHIARSRRAISELEELVLYLRTLEIERQGEVA